MRHITNISTLILILIGFSSTLIAQTNDKYRVLLNRENQKRLEFYDTTITLDYLSELRYESLTNMQIFEGFDYPKFKQETNNNVTKLSNDSIQIKLISIPFDSIRFANSYKRNSLGDYDSPYFRNLPADFDYPPFFPKTQISEIEITINFNLIKIQRQNCKHLYDPIVNCWTNNGIEMCGINGYVADNGKILLTLFCGGGTAAYTTIFVFDKFGNFEKRIEEPII